MKTAILISGHLRTLDRTLDNLHSVVLRHFETPDFFISTVRESGESRGAEPGAIRDLRAKYPHSRIEIETLDAQPELPIPLPPTNKAWQLGMVYAHEPYALRHHPQALLRQLWHLNRCWEFFLSQTQIDQPRITPITPINSQSENPSSAESAPSAVKNSDSYDLIIRLRPDSWFTNFENPLVETTMRWANVASDPRGPENLVSNGSITTQRAPHDREAFTPFWGRAGGLNPRFALLGARAAAAYFTTSAQLPALLARGYPLHLETLLAAALRENGCVLHDTLRCEFRKLHGPTAGPAANTFRDPEITMSDLAHLIGKSGNG